MRVSLCSCVNQSVILLFCSRGPNSYHYVDNLSKVFNNVLFIGLSGYKFPPLQCCSANVLRVYFFSKIMYHIVPCSDIP